MPSVAILGTGDMGAAIARTLLRAGFTVRAWNRTASRATPLAEHGAAVFDDPRDAVRGAEVVIILVFDINAVLETLERVSGVLGHDTVVVQSATVGLHIDDVIQAAEHHGIALVDAPVLGNPTAAEAGRLSVMAAGRPELRARVEPVFDAIASRVAWVGESAGAASALKLVCNAWVEGLTALAAQSFALANAFGVDAREFVSIMSVSIADSPYLSAKAAIMLEESQEVTAPLDLVHKDIELIRDAARKYGVSTVLHDAVKDLYETASAAGYGQHDLSMVVKAFLTAE